MLEECITNAAEEYIYSHCFFIDRVCRTIQIYIFNIHYIWTKSLQVVELFKLA
jgi:hypothetical protein